MDTDPKHVVARVLAQRKHAGLTIWEGVALVAVIAVLVAIAIPAYMVDISGSSPPPDGTLAAADKEIRKLEWQEMAYVAPEAMDMGSTAQVELVLGGNKTFVELISLLERTGNVEGQRVQVADRMEARLTGSAFEIVANTPETQLVTTTQATKWQWQVKAKELGDQKLYLSLNALLSVNGKDAVKSVKTFQREISVEVGSFAGFWAMVERYWTYLAVVLTAIVIPLFVFLWKRLNRPDAGVDEKR